MDGVKRMATVRIGTPFQGDATPAVKFHLGDHLGSGTLAVAGSGAWISREEFTPYGETSFGGYARKRYRFAGKERDEESGLDYFGARYFAPWLARWTTCDPAGRVDGLNLYAYAANNPVVLVDPTGRQSSQGSAGGVDPAPPEPETSDTPVAQDTGGGPPHQSITSPGIEPEHREPEPEDADIPTVDVNDLPEATEHAPAGTFRNAPPGGVGEPEWTNPAWEEGTGPFIEGFKVGAEHAVINQAEGVAATAGGPAGALVGDPVSEELDSIKSDVPDVPNESGSVGWALGYTFTNAVLLFIGGRMVELGEPGGGGPGGGSGGGGKGGSGGRGGNWNNRRYPVPEGTMLSEEEYVMNETAHAESTLEEATRGAGTRSGRNGWRHEQVARYLEGRSRDQSLLPSVREKLREAAARQRRLAQQANHGMQRSPRR